MGATPFTGIHLIIVTVLGLMGGARAAEPDYSDPPAVVEAPAEP